MKKYLIALIVLFSFSYTINAQLSLILEAGSNFGKSEFQNLPHIETLNKYGFYFAAIPSLNLPGNFAANAEIQYSQEGFHAGNETTWDAKYHYLRIIPELEYQFLELIGLYGGVDIGINVGEEVKNPGQGNWLKNSDFIKNNDLGLLLGVRVEIRKLSFDVKYNFGIKDINSITYTDIEGFPIEGVTQTNQVLQFGVGYRIGK